MKRILIVCMVVFSLFLSLTAHPVDQGTALTIAIKFMKTNDLKLSTTFKTENNIPAFYIFNTTNGFVIISANDCETPIIGYSHEGCFDPDNVPMQMYNYLQDFVERIQYGIDNQIIADDITARQWNLAKTIGRLNNNKNAKAVVPLIAAKWHQGCLYNNLCPNIENTPCGHAEVGCVAVAMGQIMHYWKFPQGGQGTHSYVSNNAILSADFGNTIYDWDHMPNSLTDAANDAEIEAVATLLFHCGVSVEMSYGSNGSGASARDIPYALLNYFRYTQDLHYEKKDCDDSEWLALLKNSLDQQRPVLYVGHGSSGHAFICDGYDDNNLLHFNWGWGGSGDGYFALGNLNPLGHDYNNSNAAIFDIIPNNELYHIYASANPPTGGTVEGFGEYQSGEQCTLTATPADNYSFYCWKMGNHIVSYDSVYAFFASENMDTEALFTLNTVRKITTQPSQQYITLSWSSRDRHIWPLLYQFETNTAHGIATDGDFIYISKKNTINMFKKYTMDGKFLEVFNIYGCYYPTELTYNGDFYYCTGKNSDDDYLYAVDLTHKYLSHKINVGHSPICAYDNLQNGIWLAVHDNTANTYRLKLVDQTGSLIKYGSYLPPDFIPNGSGFVIGADENPHLILKTEEGLVYDYDINHELFNKNSVMDCGNSFGSHIGKYNGKDAMYVCSPNAVNIFETKNVLSQISHYRLYRADQEWHITKIADQVTGTSYIDPTWNDLGTGLYRYGISLVFGSGNESEIVWSDPVTKGNYDLHENDMDATSIHPNPATDRMIIESPFPVRQCEVFTIDGKLVYSTSNCGEMFEIQTNEWGSGTYIIRLTTDAFMETKRMITIIR